MYLYFLLNLSLTFFIFISFFFFISFFLFFCNQMLLHFELPARNMYLFLSFHFFRFLCLRPCLFLYFFFLQSHAIAFLVAGIVHVFEFSFEFVFNFLCLRPFLFLYFFFFLQSDAIAFWVAGKVHVFVSVFSFEFFCLCPFLFLHFFFFVIRCYCILSGLQGICCKEQSSSQRGRAASLLQRTPAKNI